MRVTIGGQEFATEFAPALGEAAASVTLTLSIFPRTFEQFEAGMTQLLALDGEEFGGHEASYHPNGTAWVSRTARDDTVEVTVFGFEGFGHDEILEYLAGDR